MARYTLKEAAVLLAAAIAVAAGSGLASAGGAADGEILCSREEAAPRTSASAERPVERCTSPDPSARR
ncbi:hypothetical protein [Streptomyces nitrosporeus]|uniref:hypothetical protein n=1 Tax=Streptomyces nitrosporeus TaxID=28894 RepID=UPI003325968F